MPAPLSVYLDKDVSVAVGRIRKDVCTREGTPVLLVCTTVGVLDRVSTTVDLPREGSCTPVGHDVLPYCTYYLHTYILGQGDCTTVGISPQGVSTIVVINGHDVSITYLDRVSAP